MNANKILGAVMSDCQDLNLGSLLCHPTDAILSQMQTGHNAKTLETPAGSMSY